MADRFRTWPCGATPCSAAKPPSVRAIAKKEPHQGCCLAIPYCGYRSDCWRSLPAKVSCPSPLQVCPERVEGGGNSSCQLGRSRLELDHFSQLRHAGAAIGAALELALQHCQHRVRLTLHGAQCVGDLAVGHVQAGADNAAARLESLRRFG